MLSYTFLNPSFRVFEVDSVTKNIEDYIHYGFDLIEANKIGNKPDWKIRYNASELFQVENMTHYGGIKDFILSILTNKENFEKILDAFFSSGPRIKKFIKNKSKYFI